MADDRPDELDGWLADEADDGLLLSAADAVQMACSLRFDGYRYCGEALGLHHDYSAWTQRYERLFRAEGKLPAQDEDAMALCFLYQRYLGKWGGEAEPPHGLSHRLWRALVLRTIRIPTPPTWWPRGMDPSYAQRWRDRFTPRLDDAERCVREVHERMRYDDDAPNLHVARPAEPLLRPRQR